ncbi:hypothetical protein E4U14_000173 [Claviceps sp. LM454 group G7]|nr:hypothetical protein E4U14_000173 [Claviceps sp. LM454 group G7]
MHPLAMLLISDASGKEKTGLPKLWIETRMWVSVPLRLCHQPSFAHPDPVEMENSLDRQNGNMYFEKNMGLLTSTPRSLVIRLR